MLDISFTLRDIDFEVRRGQLCAVVKQVGSGKSYFLLAICGEINKISGFVYVDVSQFPLCTAANQNTNHEIMVFRRLWHNCTASVDPKRFSHKQYSICPEVQ